MPDRVVLVFKVFEYLLSQRLGGGGGGVRKEVGHVHDREGDGVLGIVGFEIIGGGVQRGGVAEELVCAGEFEDAFPGGLMVHAEDGDFALLLGRAVGLGEAEGDGVQAGLSDREKPFADVVDESAGGEEVRVGEPEEAAGLEGKKGDGNGVGEEWLDIDHAGGAERFGNPTGGPQRGGF